MTCKSFLGSTLAALVLVVACVAVAAPLGFSLAKTSWDTPLDSPVVANGTCGRQFHPLLGRPAPHFELREVAGRSWKLDDSLARGPVVVVFYYGSACPHCVKQLLALSDDEERFRELHATVVAISADSSETSREGFRRYGRFAWPLLFDPDHQVAQRYGVFRRGGNGKPDEPQHGTFVIGRDGKIHWIHRGDEPFTGNATLLEEIAHAEELSRTGR
jgi:peroxiredoxin